MFRDKAKTYVINNYTKYMNECKYDKNGEDMIKTILSMYITLAPVIFTGILNMFFCTSPLCKGINIPLDGGKSFIDGKRVFGDNKTIKGLVGYLGIGTFTNILWGIVGNIVPFIEKHNYTYAHYDNTLVYNALIGLLFGLAYALFELPNSFLKRRMDIVPGKTATGIKKYFFILLDQCDSIIGCVLVVVYVYSMSIWMFLGYIGLGIITHLVVNAVLFMFKVRKNII